MIQRNLASDEMHTISMALAQLLGLPVVDELGFDRDPFVIGEPRQATATAAAAPYVWHGEPGACRQMAQPPAAMLLTPGGQQ